MMSTLHETDLVADEVEMGSRSPQSHSLAEEEDSEDGDAYDVEEEVRAAKTLHEEDEIAPIVPSEYLTLDKLVEDQKKTAIRGIVESGEGLKRAMLRAYRNYKKEVRIGAGSEKKGPQVVDAMALLPPGYKPPKKKVKQPTKPQPPTWGRRPSNPSLRKSNSRTTVENTKLCERTSEKSAASPHMGPALVDMAPVHIDDMTNKSEEIERKYKETQDQMSAALEQSKIKRAKDLLMYVVCLRYTKSLEAVNQKLSRVFMKAVRRVQRFIREDVDAHRKRRHWATIMFPLKFLLRCRIFRKRKAVKVITLFANECASSRTLYIMKKFTRSVKQCLGHVRDFLDVNQARVVLLKKYWEKTEFAIRRRRDIADRKEARRLKAEMERRLLENAATAGKRQKQSIHAQWLEKEAEVKQMLVRSDLIQQQHRASLRAIAVAVGEEVGDPKDKEEASPSPTHKPKAPVITYDMISPEKVNRIIRLNLKLKRAAHVQNVVRDARAKANARGNVSTADVKDLLKAQKRGENEGEAALREIEQHMLKGLNRVNDSTRVDFEERPQFHVLTGKKLGKSWHAIVEEAIEQDIIDKRTG